MSLILSSVITWILKWLMRLTEAILEKSTWVYQWPRTSHVSMQVGEKIHSSWNKVVHKDVFTSLWPQVLQTRCFFPSPRCRRCRHPAASAWCSGSSPLRMVSSAPRMKLFAKPGCPLCRSTQRWSLFPFIARFSTVSWSCSRCSGVFKGLWSSWSEEWAWSEEGSKNNHIYLDKSC